MSGILQSALMNMRSFRPPPPTVIGEEFEGGYYGGQISTTADGVATHYLIVSPAATGQTTAQEKTVRTDTPGTSSLIDGPTNSSNADTSDHPAAQFCEALTIGGYTDWYMPAQMELGVLYYYLKPGTQNNSASQGSNAYAVSPQPISTNYTTSSPPQTSVISFRTGGAEAFSVTKISWSSSQNSATDQHYANFVNGELGGGGTKTDSNNVRAIRRVAVY